jgi:hypothetical protein
MASSQRKGPAQEEIGRTEKAFGVNAGAGVEGGVDAAGTLLTSAVPLALSMGADADATGSAIGNGEATGSDSGVEGATGRGGTSSISLSADPAAADGAG